MGGHGDGEKAVGTAAHPHGPGHWMLWQTHCPRMQRTGWCGQDCFGGSGVGHARGLSQQPVLPKASFGMGHLASSDESVPAALLGRRWWVGGEEGDRARLGWEE